MREYRGEWGETCSEKFHSFSDNDINHKQSMKNIQSFHVIRFLAKN